MVELYLSRPGLKKGTNKLGDLEYVIRVQPGEAAQLHRRNFTEPRDMEFCRCNRSSRGGDTFTTFKWGLTDNKKVCPSEGR